MIKKLWYIISRILIGVGIILLLNYIRYGSIAMPVHALASDNIAYYVPKGEEMNIKAFQDKIYYNWCFGSNDALCDTSSMLPTISYDLYKLNKNDLTVSDHQYINDLPIQGISLSNPNFTLPTLPGFDSPYGSFVTKINVNMQTGYFYLTKDVRYNILLEFYKGDDATYYSQNFVNSDNVKLLFSGKTEEESLNYITNFETEWILGTSVKPNFAYLSIYFTVNANDLDLDKIILEPNEIISSTPDYFVSNNFRPFVFNTSKNNQDFYLNTISYLNNGYKAEPIDYYMHGTGSSGGGHSSGIGSNYISKYDVVTQTEINITSSVCGELDIACHLNKITKMLSTFFYNIFSGNFGANDFEYFNQHHLVSSLLLIPIDFLTRIYDSATTSCTPYNIGILYGTRLVLPCINIASFVGNDLFNIIDAMFCIYMLYNIFMLIVFFIEKWTSLDDTFFLIYSPQHFGPGSSDSYVPKHGGD